MKKTMIQNKMPRRWLSGWIDPEPAHDGKERMPASVLRRSFHVEPASIRDKAHAILFITCHGLYEAFINGQRVGEFVLAPGTGDYHKRLTVQAYDVSALLVPGRNEITVTLGDGWYRGSVGIDGLTNYYGSDLALLCQLEIGGEPVLVSDGCWDASQNGPVRTNDLQQGEVYDARLENVTGWHRVIVRNYGYDNLQPTESVPVIEQERFEGKIIKTPDGSTVVDFGQNLAGYTELRVNAQEGQKIILRHGETLDENGNFTQKNFDPGDRNANGIPQKIEYICKEGMNVYKPHFAIFGFRYAKVETDVDLRDAHFTAIAVYSEMRQTGTFECGNDDVNRLFMNTLWSMRSNFCDIPTDCPTRERAGWTGDAGVFAPTAVYLADCLPVLSKWLGECRLAQRDDGLVQNIAPVNNSGSMISNLLQGSAGWGDACILVPWALYEAYGDRTVLTENYEMMKGWLAFTKKRAEKTRIQNMMKPYKKYLVDEGFHFGEWCQPDIDNGAAMKKAMMTGAPEVATAYFYRSASLMARIAEVLENEADAKYFEELAQNVKMAYRHHCLKNGRISSDRQCEYVRPVAFGLIEGEEAQKAADDLDRLVRENGYHLNTGFLSTPDLCAVLADHGHTDTAYRLLLQEECPGWLYAVKKGATTIWETWDGVRQDGTVHDSLNHYSYGAVTGWLFGGVCGIRMDAGKLTIAPHPHPSLGYAKAEWDSPYGRIGSAWHYEEDICHYSVTIPEGLTAKVILPDGREELLSPGEHQL